MNRSSIRRCAAPAAGAASLVMLLGACGSDPVTTTPAAGGAGSSTPAAGGGTLSGELKGAGASSQEAAMQAWIAGFQTSNPDLTVNYNPVGSGGGRTQFIDGAVAFAGSDSVMDEEETTASAKRCGGEPAIHLPDYISPIAVAFNLEGVETLNLSPALIAQVFDQKITKWNDPAIAELNPDATLPDTDITPVNRSDESGTTENFTEYLVAAAKADWPYEASGDWPVKGGEAANGTSGVVSAITAADGAIGYADASQVGDLGKVSVQVGEEFVPFSPEAAAAVVAESEKVPGRGKYDLALELARDSTKAGTYPIVLVSYHIACLSYDDPEDAAKVKGFLSYVTSAEGQEAAAAGAGSAPISEELRTEITASIEAIK